MHGLTPEPKWVSILRDPAAALWFLRCTVPCRPQGWCMGRMQDPPRPMCYLGGATSQEGARTLADRYGYGVTP